MKTQYWHTAYSHKKFNLFNVMSNCLILVALFSTFTASAHPMIQAWQNRTGSGKGFSIQPKISYFSTSQNLNANSQAVSLLNGATVNRTYFEVNGSYGFSQDLFAFARLSGLYTNISSVGFSAQSTSNFGLNDQLAGLAWRAVHLENGTSFNLQAESTIPAYSNNNALISNSPFLGDGSFDMTFGGFVEVPLYQGTDAQYYLDAGAGYTYRSNGFSAAIPWNVQIKRYPALDGLILAAGARGNWSLDSDTTSFSSSTNDSNRGAAGSNLISAYNPSWTLVQAAFGYQDKNNIQYTLSGAYPITGKNIPDGVQLSLGVQLEFGASASETTSKKIKKTKKASFVEYDLTAKVTSVNDQLYLVKIDQGSENGISVGQLFDILDDTGVVARAKVTKVKSDESALTVVEYFKETTIETDSTAKRVIGD